MTPAASGAQRTAVPAGAALRPGMSEFLVPAAIGSAELVGATSVTVSQGDRVSFAAVVVVAAMLALPALLPMPARGAVLPARAGLLAAGWLVLAGAYSLAALAQVSWTPRYFVGDLALSLLPLLFVLAYVARPGWLASTRGLVALVTCLMVAALVAPVTGVLGTRHDPPSTLLTAAAWYVALQARSRGLRAVAFAAVAVVGALAYTSGFRTSLVVWAMAPVVVLASVRRPRSAVKVAALGALVAVGLAMTTRVDTAVVQGLQASRFESMLSGRPDQSLETRFLEAGDVLSTIDDEWLPGQALLGYGYGASYLPNASFIEANVGTDGRVHSIHVGPVLVFFRFGILGLALSAGALVIALRVLRGLRRPSGVPSWISPDLVAVSAVGLLLFSIESLMLNAMVQPAMAWCLSIVLASWAWSGRPRRSAHTDQHPAEEHGHHHGPGPHPQDRA